MKTFNYLSIAGLSLLVAATPALAEVIASTPLGVVSSVGRGFSDTRLSVPLHRPEVYAASVLSTGGTNGELITVDATPNWTPNSFQFNPPAQTNTYYLTFTSGSQAGSYYTVMANGDNTLTLDLAGESLIGEVEAGDEFQVIPYWTLSTLFPPGILVRTNQITGSGRATRIIFPNITSAGIDLAGAATYYYFSGTTFGGAGWRQAGGGFNSIRNHDVILPDAPIIFRQLDISSSPSLTSLGRVAVGAGRLSVGTLEANTPQDNTLAIGNPVALSLGESNLVESGAFVGTSQITGTGGDQLLIYDNTIVANDKSAAKVFYYYTGMNFGGPGWRLVSGGFDTIRDDEEVFVPASGFVIRKQAAASPSTAFWTIPARY